MDHRPPVGQMRLPLNNSVDLDRCQAISATLAKALASIALIDGAIARDSLLQLLCDGRKGDDRFLDFHGIPLLYC